MRPILTILAVMLATATGMAYAQDSPPDAHLKFSGFSVGLFIGYNHGQGILDFQNKQYHFTIKGINIATAGFSRVDAIGQIYQLRDIKDFAGHYMTFDVGFTLYQGGGNTMLRNDKGVVLYLQNLQSGGVSIVPDSPVTPDNQTKQRTKNHPDSIER
ncbi:MAG: hypothetical protein CSA09_04015 [Candidatus Contendobacter odensis]|uniref:Uncharacterized protein n=1 Tax=Candidatus Contendibacter odensensis TaxID=1400860 RepID=A0A2G6PEJ7_9GAMM|nr:MAG: hypothetical protein CSA09_04015 [Candidatus Contendobacter odensis]